MIDLYKLHIFDIVAQTGSFSTAAEQLYITQSAVSQHIKDLENSLGQQLFRRERRGVTLTPSGEILVDYSRQIFALVARAENALTNVAQLSGGKVTLGATPGVGIYLAPDWVQAFRAQYPQLTVALQTGVTSQIVAEVLARHVDIGIIEGELDEPHAATLSVHILEAVDQIAVVGAHHPLWDHDTVTLDELGQQSFIVRQSGSQSRTWIETLLHDHGLTPTIGAEFDNLESMKRAVSAGRCLAILPPYVVESELEHGQLRAVAIPDLPLKRTLKLIWDSKASFPPIVRAFLVSLSTRFPTLEGLLSL